MTIDQLRKCVELMDELEDVLNSAILPQYFSPDDQMRYCRDDAQSIQRRFKAQLAKVEASKLTAMKTQK